MFLSEFDSFLMYIDNHTKSHNFLKISIFPIRCSLSVVVHNCLKKSTFLTKFNFFFSKIDIFTQKLMLRKTVVTLPQRFARLDFITVLKNLLIWSKTNTFCIKWYFLPKRNNAIKIWHFSKTGNTSLRKLDIATRNEHFWKEWPFARKMKISFNIGVSARSSLLPVKHT